MDEDDHRRADEEMKLLHFHHCHQRKETQKFIKRLTSMLYKALLLTIALGFLCLLPSRFTAFARYSRPALLARSWDAVSILLVSFVISFGFLGRGQPDVQEIDRTENAFYLNRLFESNDNFGDSAPKSTGSNDSAFESNGCEDVSQKSDGFEAVLDSGYQSSHKSEVNHADFLLSTVIADISEGLENKQSLSTVEGSRRSPPAPEPPTNPPPENDSNMGPPTMRHRSLKRKRKTVYHSVPPPPPTAHPAVETLFPKHRSKGAYGHEKLERPPKIDKKSDNKNPSTLPPRPPPRPNEDGVTVNHVSRHRRSRNKEDSQHRTKEDEYRHKSSKDAHKYTSAEDIDNAPGLPDRKHKKIPYQPTTPPLPSTLQQWWSSYKKESKHKSKDSEPSPRRHSNKSSRNVHSSSSDPPAPPPLVPLPSTFMVDRISKHHGKVHYSTSTPPLPPLPPTSTVERISKHHRKVHSSTTAAPAPPTPTLIVERISKHLRNGGISENNGWSNSRGDETSEIKDSSNSSKEKMVGNGKAEEDLASWKSLPIPLPPPPPPPPLPPFLMFQDQQHLSNDRKREKRKSPAAESAKFEPGPEHGRAFAFRKQFSLDNANPHFCQSPSPDEVNRKADAFIARFREQIRLQK